MAICTALLGFSPPASWASEPEEINFVGFEVLADRFQDVGLAIANRIVEYREAYGPFEHIDELAAVQGFGSAIVGKNRSVLRLQ